MDDLFTALQGLSAQGVDGSKLYKFFTPVMAPLTVKEFGLSITPDELSALWLQVKDNFEVKG